MTKGYIVIMLSIFIICTGCSRTSKEIELQNKVDQLERQIDELKGVKREENSSSIKEDESIKESEMPIENESETEISANKIEIKEINFSNESKEEIYNDAITRFHNGEFELAQQMFLQLDDFEDSYIYIVNI